MHQLFDFCWPLNEECCTCVCCHSLYKSFHFTPLWATTSYIRPLWEVVLLLSGSNVYHTHRSPSWYFWHGDAYRIICPSVRGIHHRRNAKLWFLLDGTSCWISSRVAGDMRCHVVHVRSLYCCSHALESYTALPYTERTPRPADPKLRPAYQGSNPLSDVWALYAIRAAAKYFKR